jgi:pilus assembly protein CpaE
MRVALLSQDAGLHTLFSQVIAGVGDRFEAVVGSDDPAVEAPEGLPDPLLLILLIDLAPDPAARLHEVRRQAERLPGAPILAIGPTLPPETLIAGMQAGITEYLPQPLSADALTAALLRVGRRFGVTAEAQQTGQIFAFLPAKGGAGATSAAVNFAVELHRATGQVTLLVDLDLELGGVALWLGLRPRFSFLDLVRNYHRLDAGLLGSYLEHHESGVRVLPAPPKPERADVISAEEASRVFTFLKQANPYVVLDLSRSFTPLTLTALHDADLTLAVTTPDLPSLGSLKRLLPILARFGNGNGDRLRVVLNRYSAGDTVTVDDVRTVLEMDVHWTLSNDYETVSRAGNEGKPAVLERRSAYSRDVAKIVGQITNGKARPAEGPRTSGFALRQLWTRGSRR